jgi:DNA-binding NarL/FixJ family response regulator
LLKLFLTISLGDLIYGGFINLRLLIADDNQKFIETAHRFISTLDNIECIGSANNGYDTLALIKALNPDVVLMDLSMPGMGGLEATRLIKELSNPPKVVIVTLHDEIQYFTEAVKSGADAFVSKLELVDKLTKVLNTLFSKEEELLS